MKFSLSRGAALLQATLASAQLATYSPTSDTSISYAVNVPQLSASSGSGDIFIQIKGPVSGSNARTWIAIGQAQSSSSAMTNANIFIVYPNAKGDNVTLSPRLGKGFFEPGYNSAAQAELIGGSGIENGILTANIKCSNCNSWSGGQMSFTDSSSNWIWSSAAYGALNSDDKSADLSMHNERDTFTFDLSKAAGGSSANPFTTSSSSTNTTSGSSNSGSSDSSGPSDSKLPTIITTHAAIMSLAFLLFYPLGAIIMRIGVGSTTMWVHAALQGFSWILAVIGMGLGIWMALQLDELSEAHPIIGLVTVCLLVFQAPLGYLHHSFYKKQGGRTAVSYVHIWLGRALMTLGAINGGLGLQLAGNENPSGTIAYGVLAGIIYAVYFGIIIGTFGKGKKAAARNGTLEDQKRERTSQTS